MKRQFGESVTYDICEMDNDEGDGGLRTVRVKNGPETEGEKIRAINERSRERRRRRRRR